MNTLYAVLYYSQAMHDTEDDDPDYTLDTSKLMVHSFNMDTEAGIAYFTSKEYTMASRQTFIDPQLCVDYAKSLAKANGLEYVWGEVDDMLDDEDEAERPAKEVDRTHPGYLD